MADEKLSDTDVYERLREANGWSLVTGSLHREYVFTDFTEAFAFLARVALVSEKLNHHANIFNCYNRVTLDIHTHDAEGITERDFKWVSLVDGAVK